MSENSGRLHTHSIQRFPWEEARRREDLSLAWRQKAADTNAAILMQTLTPLLEQDIHHPEVQVRICLMLRSYLYPLTAADVILPQSVLTILQELYFQPWLQSQLDPRTFMSLESLVSQVALPES